MNSLIYGIIQKETDVKVIDYRCCKWCGEKYGIFDLQEKIEEKIWIQYKQDLCYSCIMKRLMMFRNEKKLFIVRDVMIKNFIN